MAGEMSQYVKLLLYKSDNLSLDCQTTEKLKLGVYQSVTPAHPWVRIWEMGKVIS